MLSVVAVTGILLTYDGWVAAVDLTGWPYIGANVALAIVLVVAARSFGLSFRSLGISRASVYPSLRWGAKVLGVLAAGAVAALLAYDVVVHVWPHFAISHSSQAPGLGLTIFRIFIGTALCEEIFFRGVLFALWERWRSTRAAVMGSSVTFGIWHVAPTLRHLVGSREGAVVGWLAVLGSVLITAGFGLFLAWFGRVRTRGIWGGVVVHAGVNSLGVVLAVVAAHIG